MGHYFKSAGEFSTKVGIYAKYSLKFNACLLGEETKDDEVVLNRKLNRLQKSGRLLIPEPLPPLAHFEEPDMIDENRIAVLAGIQYFETIGEVEIANRAAARAVHFPHSLERAACARIVEEEKRRKATKRVESDRLELVAV